MKWGTVTVVCFLAIYLYAVVRDNLDAKPKLGDNRDNFGPSVVENFQKEPEGKVWESAVQVIEVVGETPMRLALVNHQTGGLARVQVSNDVNVGDDIYVTAYTLQTRLLPATDSLPSMARWYIGTKK